MRRIKLFIGSYSIFQGVRELQSSSHPGNQSLLALMFGKISHTALTFLFVVDQNFLLFKNVVFYV